MDCKCVVGHHRANYLRCPLFFKQIATGEEATIDGEEEENTPEDETPYEGDEGDEGGEGEVSSIRTDCGCDACWEVFSPNLVYILMCSPLKYYEEDVGEEDEGGE